MFIVLYKYNKHIKPLSNNGPIKKEAVTLGNKNDESSSIEPLPNEESEAVKKKRL